MSCLPNMPCWNNTTNPETTSNSGCSDTLFTALFPCGCNPVNINSTNVIYTGEDLPNSGIKKGDNLTLILSKLDALL